MASKEGTGSPGGKCCGVVNEAVDKSRERREERKNKPQPWLVLKMAIGITLGIIGYASYVYIGRFCIPMIRHNEGSLGGRNIGIPFLVVYCIFLLMMLWTYAMVVFTGPGKARDHVEKSPPPVFHKETFPTEDTDSGIGGAPYEAPPSSVPSDSHSPAPSNDASAHLTTSEKPPQQEPELNAGVTDAIPPVAAARVQADNGEGSTLSGNGLPMMFTRKPASYPILNPKYRYCHRDGFVKPLRAHHCRACGTCILKYDHHCPWIGQCVGAHNHKFFFHFLQWAAIFCMWTFSTLLGGTVKASTQDNDVDPQFIVIIALAGLFMLFTITLAITHMRLILLNQSTVENIGAQSMKEREKIVLSRMFKFYQFGAKRRARKQWDAEWGAIDTEGNLFWLGSARRNWESVMGPNVWHWFLPIGRTPADGIEWPINPRHDQEGRWRPRREWPPELR